MASLVAMDLVGLPGSDREVLPRAAVLIMGGDEVYPTPDAYRYE